MVKLLKESKYEINFKDSIFYKPGILIGEEFGDILPSTAVVLKEILSEKGYRDKRGKTESLIASVIVASNTSAAEISDDDSKAALYEDRFPIKATVTWESFTATNYFKLLQITFKEAKQEHLFFMARLFESNFTTTNKSISPRVALNITKAYLKGGIDFISSFELSMENIYQIKQGASKELSRRNALISCEEVITIINKETIEDSKLFMFLYALYKTSTIKVDDSLVGTVSNFKQLLISNIEHLDKSDTLVEIDKLFKEIDYDKSPP